MFAIAVIGILALYALVSLVVIAGTVRYAQTRGRRGWLWGLGAAFVMYNLLFWDWIPTVYVHKYYCEKEAGFWIYKTLDQWKAENPGGMETLVANKVSIQRVGDDENHTDTQILNQRFSWIRHKQRPISLLTVYSSRSEIVDSGNGDVLARYVDFSRGKGSDDLKFWMNLQGCPSGTENRIALLNFADNLIKMTDTTQRNSK